MCSKQLFCVFPQALCPPQKILCRLETKMFLHLFVHVFHVNEINNEMQNTLLLSLFNNAWTLLTLEVVLRRNERKYCLCNSFIVALRSVTPNYPNISCANVLLLFSHMQFFFYSLSANICSFLSVSQQLNTSVVHFPPKRITIKH